MGLAPHHGAGPKGDEEKVEGRPPDRRQMGPAPLGLLIYVCRVLKERPRLRVFEAWDDVSIDVRVYKLETF